MTKTHTNTLRRRWKQLHKKFLRKGLSQQEAAEKCDALLGTAVSKVLLPANSSPQIAAQQDLGGGREGGAQ